MEKLAKLKLSVQDICEVTGESRSNIMLAIKRGHLRVFRVGKRWHAKPEAVQAFVNWLEAQSDKGKPVSYQARSPDARA
jgi:excisionase family DNA binding protein